MSVINTGPEQSFLDSVMSNEALYEAALPPVEQWTPDLNGDLDMRIDREGRWFYLGDEIRRHSMVKMFSSILRREGDEYFLLTPVEKWRIVVDRAPFLITGARKEMNEQGDTVFVLTTNVDNELVLGKRHPLWVVDPEPNAEPQPMVMVRNNLPGLLSRNVFYQLAEEAEVKREGGREGLYLSSEGEIFRLGYLE